MPDAYYVGLLSCSSKKQAEDFKLFLATKNLEELTDQDCREVLAEIDVMEARFGDDAPALECPVTLAIEDLKEDGYTLYTDAEREVARCVMLGVALPKGKRRPIEFEVLTGMFTEGEDFSDDHVTLIRIYFDGSSHQSRRPRLWVGCKNPDHSRCYKYVFLHHHPTLKDAVLFSAASTKAC